MKAFKCPKCSGDVKYDIRKAVMSCEHCGADIQREAYQKYLNRNSLYVTHELVCPQCGAAMLSYDDTISTFCAYCGSSVSFTRRIVEDTKPDGILPFSITAEEALEAYSHTLRRAFFAPDQMLKDSEKKLAGIYMPYYTFSVNANEHVSSLGRRSSHDRPGALEEYRISYNLKASYNGIRFDAAKAFPDFLSESIDTYRDNKTPGEDPRQTGIQQFETSYLAGFYADGGDVSEKLYTEVVDEIVRGDLRRGGWTCQGFELDSYAQNPEIHIQARKNLYPVWLITHRWKDRVSYAAVNGQNATAAVEIPVDKKKYLLSTVILTALISLLLNNLLTIHPIPTLLISEGLLLLMGIRLYFLNRDLYLRQQRMDDLGWLGCFPDRSLASVKQKYPSGFRSPGKTFIGIFIGALIIGLTVLCISGNTFAAQRVLGFLAKHALLLLFLFLAVVISAILLSNRNRGYWKRSVTWTYWVPGKVFLKAFWRVLLGAVFVGIIILSDPADDNIYYAAAIFNLLMSMWSALELFEAQNLLMSREIPIFTRKRGGD